MPWDGDTFQLNLFGPFENFYNSLLATPPTEASTAPASKFPTDEHHRSVPEPYRRVSLTLRPVRPGKPGLPGDVRPTGRRKPGALSRTSIAWDPTNTYASNYVTNFAADNNATQPSRAVNDSVALLQTGEYNLSPTELAQVDTALGNINPELPALLTNGGILTDPDYLTYITDPTAPGLTDANGLLNRGIRRLQPLARGQRPPDTVPRRLTKPTDPTLFTDLNTVATDLSFPGNPAALDAVLGISAAATAGEATDPTGLSADLSTLLSSMGTTAGSDLLSQLVSELGTQLTTDLGTLLPSSLLSMF